MWIYVAESFGYLFRTVFLRLFAPISGGSLASENLCDCDRNPRVLPCFAQCLNRLFYRPFVPSFFTYSLCLHGFVETCWDLLTQSFQICHSGIVSACVYCRVYARPQQYPSTKKEHHTPCSTHNATQHRQIIDKSSSIIEMQRHLHHPLVNA